MSNDAIAFIMGLALWPLVKLIASALRTLRMPHSPEPKEDHDFSVWWQKLSAAEQARVIRVSDWLTRAVNNASRSVDLES